MAAVGSHVEGFVASVAGPVPVGRLGVVLMHEHLFITNPEMTANYPWRWDEPARMAEAVDALQRVRDNGISTVIDLTAPGMGRDVSRVAGVAAQVPDVNVVVATGYFTGVDVAASFR